MNFLAAFDLQFGILHGMKSGSNKLLCLALLISGNPVFAIGAAHTPAQKEDPDVQDALHLAEAMLDDSNADNDLEAVETLRRISDKSASACYTLGVMYISGDVLEKDIHTGTLLLYKAAHYNHPAAMGDIGLLHERGIGTEIDFKEAAEWYSKAIEYGDIISHTQLAHLLERRLVPDQNHPYKSAQEHYQIAAEAGDSVAMFRLGLLTYDHLENLRNKLSDTERQRRDLQKQKNTSDHNKIMRLRKLERDYKNQIRRHLPISREIDPDSSNALYWIDKSARTGHGPAIEFLADYYYAITINYIDPNRIKDLDTHAATQCYVWLSIYSTICPESDKEDIEFKLEQISNSIPEGIVDYSELIIEEFYDELQNS